MNKGDFEKIMIDLATCKLSPEEWASYWIKHEASIKASLSQG